MSRVGKVAFSTVAALALATGTTLLPRAAGSAADGSAGAPTCFGVSATEVGTDGNDRIRGADGEDVIVARGGNDRLIGLGARDLICAGPGRDVIYGGDRGDWVRGGPGIDHLDGGNGGDRLLGGPGDDRSTTNDPHAMGIDGGNGRDKLRGGPGRDHLDGQVQEDRIHGGADDDVLNGDSFDDYLNGGTGEDRLWGAGGKDVCTNGEHLADCELTDTPPERTRLREFRQISPRSGFHACFMSDCRRGGAVLCPAGRAARHRGVDCSDHLPRFRFTHGRR